MERETNAVTNIQRASCIRTKQSLIYMLLALTSPLSLESENPSGTYPNMKLCSSHPEIDLSSQQQPV